MTGIWDNIFASSIVLLVLIALTVVVLGILSLKGTGKRRKHFEDLHRRLQSGQKVVTSGGIYGKLVNVSDETVDMAVKSGAVITVSRFTISEIID